MRVGPGTYDQHPYMEKDMWTQIHIGRGWPWEARCRHGEDGGRS